MGETSVKKSFTDNMMTITFGKYFFASSLERWTHWIVADRRQCHPTWLRRKVFIWTPLHAVQSSRSFINWSFCDRSIWFLLHLTWDYFDSSDWRICLVLVGRIYLFSWSIQYFYRIYLLWRRSTCNIIVIILPVFITCIPVNKPVLLHRSRSSELCCIPAIDHRTYFFNLRSLLWFLF